MNHEPNANHNKDRILKLLYKVVPG